MEIKHPYAGIDKRLTLSDSVTAFVKALKKEPPQVEMKERVKPYWKEQGLSVKGFGPGVVPAGKYTDPGTPEARDAVLGLYKHLKGEPISRHKVAVALNFQMSDEVDKVRAALKEAGVTDIDAGDRGRSVRWVGEGASYVAPAKVKKAAAPKADTSKADAKAADAKAADAKKAAPKKADAPAGSRPAKKAAAAAKAAEQITEKVAAPPAADSVVAGSAAQ